MISWSELSMCNGIIELSIICLHRPACASSAMRHTQDIVHFVYVRMLIIALVMYVHAHACIQQSLPKGSRSLLFTLQTSCWVYKSVP